MGQVGTFHQKTHLRACHGGSLGPPLQPTAMCWWRGGARPSRITTEVLLSLSSSQPTQEPPDRKGWWMLEARWWGVIKGARATFSMVSPTKKMLWVKIATIPNMSQLFLHRHFSPSVETLKRGLDQVKSDGGGSDWSSGVWAAGPLGSDAATEGWLSTEAELREHTPSLLIWCVCSCDLWSASATSTSPQPPPLICFFASCSQFHRFSFYNHYFFDLFMLSSQHLKKQERRPRKISYWVNFQNK